MVHVCKIMVAAFAGLAERHDERGVELFDDRDVEAGVIYAEDLRGAGYVTCPVDGFDLATFEAWCRAEGGE